MTPEDWLVQAAQEYEFRPRRRHEARQEYFAALVQHVESRDYAAAHELRIGRRQADWTPEDVDAFQRRLQRPHNGPRQAFARGVAPNLRMGMVFQSRYAATDEGLLELIDASLSAQFETRVHDPKGSLPIFASVMSFNGELLTTTVDRGDRVAVLKYLAQRLPVFAFLLVFDAFIHAIDTESRKASKRDAIIAQAGTRTRRITRVKPYEIVDGAVRALPPPPDHDTAAPNGWHVTEDPYASIFVSVPTPTGEPS